MLNPLFYLRGCATSASCIEEYLDWLFGTTKCHINCHTDRPPRSDSSRNSVALMGVYMLPFCINDGQIAYRESSMNQMLSAVEVAQVLGVSIWTIRQWSSQRKLR